jgi:FKBP-type peptidyl-prolyl cis-trans isomerase
MKSITKRTGSPGITHWLQALAVALGLMLTAAPTLASDTAFQQGPGGLRIKEMQQGQGPGAIQGQVATIHFIGWFDEEGVRGREIFNSRKQRGEPVSFVIGTDGVMPAWNAGVIGMQVGAKRMLLVPPGMAYGKWGVEGVVPPGASLIFQIELIRLED